VLKNGAPCKLIAEAVTASHPTEAFVSSYCDAICCTISCLTHVLGHGEMQDGDDIVENIPA